MREKVRRLLIVLKDNELDISAFIIITSCNFKVFRDVLNDNQSGCYEHAQDFKLWILILEF